MTVNVTNDKLVLLIALRKTISGEGGPTAKDLLKTSILGIFSQIFKITDIGEEERATKLESLWILTNLALGDKNDVLKILEPQYEVIDIIKQVFSGDDYTMIESVFLLLNNIVAENSRFRDLILSKTELTNTINKILEGQKISISLLGKMCEVLAKMFEFKGFSKYDAESGLKVARAGIDTEDLDIIKHSLWIIRYLVDTRDDQMIIYVAQQDLIHNVLHLMGSNDFSVRTLALQIMSQILCVKDTTIIDCCL